MGLKTVDDLCFLFFNYSQLTSPSYMVYIVFLECEIIQLAPTIVKQNNCCPTGPAPYFCASSVSKVIMRTFPDSEINSLGLLEAVTAFLMSLLLFDLQQWFGQP